MGVLCRFLHRLPLLGNGVALKLAVHCACTSSLQKQQQSSRNELRIWGDNFIVLCLCLVIYHLNTSKLHEALSQDKNILSILSKTDVILLS